MMSLQTIQNNSLLKELIFKIWLWDAKFKIKRIAEYINPQTRIIDIGTGPGSVCLLLNKQGFNLTPVDVIDQSLSEEIEPEIYDGERLPYSNDSFDTALILTVLHHTPNPKEILLEAKRVSKRIIIIEDIYSNPLQKYLTYFVDSIVNMEFWGHPHSNKSDKCWRELFSELGLKLKAAKYDRFILFFRQASYYLEK